MYFWLFDATCSSFAAPEIMGAAMP